jgi:uncharacterized YccA/Bax inhibitor family protein
MANPMFNEERVQSYAGVGRMTAQGTILKTGILLLLLLFTAVWSWSAAIANPGIAMPLMIGSMLLGLGMVIWSVIKPAHSPLLAPAYALVEGVFVGVVSLVFSTMIPGAYSGMVSQAVVITIGILAVMLGLYVGRIIVVTDKLRSMVMIATFGVMAIYLLSFGLSFFGISVPYIHEGGLLGIGFSLLVIGIASFNLLLDFDFIEKGENYGLPAYMEWFGAMGLVVTLVWLYIEVLRLLSKLNRD